MLSSRVYLMMAVLVSGMVAIPSAQSAAAAPSLVNYQGILTNGSGTPQVGGPFSITFSIYDDASATNPALWSELQPVTTDAEGRFNVLLGTVTPLTDAVFSGADRWLGTRVSPDPSDLLPRTRVASVAYALRPATVDGATGGNISTKVSIGPGHTNTGSNAFVAGSNNSATGNFATVSGGSNTATMQGSAIGGGLDNAAFGEYSTVAGGSFDTASAKNTAIGGGYANTVTAIYGTVAGGIFNSASGDGSGVAAGSFNVASGSNSIVGGGYGDTAAGFNSAIAGGSANNISSFGTTSAIGGGTENRITSNSCVIAGGYQNSAAGSYSTVPGGWGNLAGGHRSFAAGMFSKARGDGSVVISANNSVFTTDTINTNNAEQMVLRADAGIYITNTSGDAPANVGDLINTVSGAHLTTGGTWTDASDVALKENFAEINAEDLLARIAQLPIREWNYKAEPDAIRHIGPTAQDFYRLFEIGTDDKSIAPRDLAALALAAIQRLDQRNRELNKYAEMLQSRIARLEAAMPMGNR